MPKGGFITGGACRGNPEDFHPIDAVTVEDFSGGQVAFQGREDLTALLGLLTASDNIFDQLAAVDRNNLTSQ
ncbi:hypothetical protein [Corynebacterium durum]|uniref:hypothetical protein n=1 Tax=Corynebacterium durum TaxID=61592 RepID=UPI00288BF0FE|nr:hypothetical protein [Corynebacterium durum]